MLRSLQDGAAWTRCIYALQCSKKCELVCESMLVHAAGKALRKLVMQTRANSVAWNPMEAFNFTAASEDCNLYSYDMRKLSSATCVHQAS